MELVFEIIYKIPSPILLFFTIWIIFLPMELTFPAYKHQKTFRPHWFIDLLYYIGQALIWTILVYKVIFTINAYYFSNFATYYANFTRSLPIFIQVILTIVLSDLCIYWFHRWQHKNNFLWRFHKIHHTAEHLDWLASYREHPVDTFFTILVINVPSILLGLSNSAIAVFIIFRGVWAIYIHSNIKLNIGIMKYVLGSPEINHWHHFKDKKVGNYANLFPVMDLFFGTHYYPHKFPEELGIENNMEQNYWKQIILPLLPKKNTKNYYGTN